MSVDVDIPNPWNFNANANISGGLDLDLDEIRIKELPTIRLSVDNLPVINLNADLSVKELPTIKLETDSKVDLGLDNVKVDLGLDNVRVDLGLDNIRIKELPEICFNFGLKPMRCSFPLSYKFGISFFKFNVFTFEVCGEGMSIFEDYRPRKTEICK